MKIVVRIEKGAPSLEPFVEVTPLFIVTTEVNQQVDITPRSGSGVFYAAKDVYRYDAELIRIEIGRDPLCHPKPPSPMGV